MVQMVDTGTLDDWFASTHPLARYGPTPVVRPPHPNLPGLKVVAKASSSRLSRPLARWTPSYHICPAGRLPPTRRQRVAAKSPSIQKT